MSNHLSIALSAAVPLHIIELKAKGGPDAEDLKQAQEFSKDLGERGDVLLFGSKKKGEAAGLFNGLAKSLAVLSFCPGGVTLFGNHWETKIDEQLGKTPTPGDIQAEGKTT
jgi:hypothetical protein